MAEVERVFARQVQWMDGHSGYNTTQQGASTELVTQSDENRPKQKQTLSSKGSTKLDSNFLVHPSKSFKKGRVLMTLWSEPKGGQDGRCENTPAKYHSIRRFIIIKSPPGQCLCVPILTYKGRNTTKSGVKPEDHALVYSGTKKVVDGISQIGGNKMCREIIKVKNGDVGRSRTRNKQDMEGTSCDIQKLICEDCGGKLTCKNDTGTESRVFYGIPRTTLTLLNIGSGHAMGASFTWLNARMGLGNPGPTINWITDTVEYYIPNRMLEILEGMPNQAVFCFFILATAVFTGTTFSWATCERVTNTVHILTWACVLMGLIVWMIVGVNAAELVLICLPQSIGLGILLGCLLEGKIDGNRILEEENDLIYDV